jgi:hypothetical protein
VLRLWQDIHVVALTLKRTIVQHHETRKAAIMDIVSKQAQNAWTISELIDWNIHDQSVHIRSTFPSIHSSSRSPLMAIKGLHRAAREMTIGEGLQKLVISMVFVPVPIVALTPGGFWLDYHELNATPLFLALGAVLGTFISFIGVCKIIAYGH